MWIIYGWDSGIDQVLNPEMYGRSFHFSTMVTYGLLSYFTSKHLEKLGILEAKNIIFSQGLVAFNAMIFELPYMALFQTFQLQTPLLTWFIRDLWFLTQYIGFLCLGVWAVWGVYRELKEKTTFDIRFWEFIGLFWLFIWSWLLWINYPFPTVTIFFNGWKSQPLFPQTHYAYVNSTLYAANDLLHALNVGVKALMALIQLYLLRRVKLR